MGDSVGVGVSNSNVVSSLTEKMADCARPSTTELVLFRSHVQPEVIVGNLGHQLWN